MSDIEAMWLMVRANPSDDTVRLVFADLVQEQGCEAHEEIAELIRAGMLCSCVTEYQDFANCGMCSGKRWLRRCESEKCVRPGFHCYEYDAIWTEEEGWEDGPVNYYCPACAIGRGFCSRCGHRREPYMLSRSTHLCHECGADDHEIRDDRHEPDGDLEWEPL